MKKIVTFLLVLTAVGFQSCTGPAGPPGAPGLNGVNVEAEVFEVTRSFTVQNGFASDVLLNPPIFASDHILIYRLAGSFQGEDDWKFVPEYFFFEDGTLDYSFNYSFTRTNIGLFMEGFDLAGINQGLTTNQIFRIVIVPGYFANARVNYQDYENTMSILGLTEADVKPIELRK